MEIRFFYDTKSVQKSVDILRPFAGHVPASMRFRYPEKLLEGGDIASAVLKADEDAYNPSKMRDALAHLWEEKKNVVLDSLMVYCERNNLSLYEEYFCALTFYGPYGFYELPDTVFLNVAMEKDADFLFETMLHELLHIVLGNQLESMEYMDREKLVDDTFVEIWGSEFPLYEKQFPE